MTKKPETRITMEEIVWSEIIENLKYLSISLHKIVALDHRRTYLANGLKMSMAQMRMRISGGRNGGMFRR